MITDTFLYEIAKKINGESSTSPNYIDFSSTAITPDVADTSLPGVIAGGGTATQTRYLNTVTFNKIRSGAVASSTGDYINALGLSLNGGNLFAEALVPSILHTSSYDLEADWDITVNRS